MQPDRGTEKLLKDAQELRVLHELTKDWKELMGRLDPPNPRVVGFVEGLKIVDVSVSSESARALEEVLQLDPKRGKLLVAEHVLCNDVPVLMVLLDLRFAQHLSSPVKTPMLALTSICGQICASSATRALFRVSHAWPAGDQAAH